MEAFKLYIEVKELVMQGEYKTKSELEEDLKYLFSPLTDKMRATLIHLQKRRDIIELDIKRGILPTFKQVCDFEFLIKELVLAYNLTTYDTAKPQPYMDALREQCSSEAERDLLRFTVYGYDENDFRHGGLAALNIDTFNLLTRLNAYLIPTI